MILPAKANTLVPLDFSVPILAKLSAPSKKITGIFANVSTLLTIVGLLNKPCSAGNGGLTTGSPLLPSIDEIKAVSSPHTKAPAPYLIWISNEKSVPKMFLPNKPNLRV